MMTSKNNVSPVLCRLPDSVNFQFKEEQQMNTSIIINNLINRCVNFKLKTNKPGLYLVKPMEGQIYNNSNIQITFKRKQLTLENYNMILSNPGQNREKFLIEFSSEVQDGVGNLQTLSQLVYLAVNFIRDPIQNSTNANSKQIKLEKVNNDLDNTKIVKSQPVELKRIDSMDITKEIALKKAQYEKLILTKQSLLRKNNTNELGKSLTLQDLIYTALFSFLVGFIFL